MSSICHWRLCEIVRFVKIVVFSSFTATGSYQFVAAQDVEALVVSGTVESNDYYGKTNSQLMVARARFKVTIPTVKNSDIWNIQAIFEENHTLNFSCDGTNVYDYLVDDRLPEIVSKNTASGTITRGSFPTHGGWYVTLPWLAFASSKWLDKSRKNDLYAIPALWKLPFADPAAHIYNCSVMRSHVEPELPSEVFFYVNKELVDKTKQGIYKSLSWLDPLEKKILAKELDKQNFDSAAAVYRVNEWRSVGKYEVPTSFTLTQYNVSQFHGMETQRVWTVTCGKVMEIYTTNLDLLLPEMSHVKSWITDFRFRDSKDRFDSISYMVTNRAWPSETAPIVLAALKKYEDDPPARQKRTTTLLHRSLIHFILISTTLIPPIFLFLVWWSKKKQQKTQQAK